MNNYEQLFILGAPRSGTTFLSSLLANTRYGVPVETQVVTKYYKKLANYGDLSGYAEFSALMRSIMRERAIMQWKLDINIQEFYAGIQDDVSYPSILNKLFSIRRDEISKFAWGDKTPHYLGDVDIIDSVFPNAKYIYIVRDGRDVALSLLQKEWGPNNIYACAKYWSWLNRESNTIKKLRQNNQLYFIKYEDLLDNVEVSVKTLYSFLNEEVDDLTIRQLTSNTIVNNKQKWKSMLTERQIAVFESVAGETLRKFDYSLSTAINKLPKIVQWYYSFHNFFIRQFYLIKLNIYDGFRIRFLGAEPFDQ